MLDLNGCGDVAGRRLDIGGGEELLPPINTPSPLLWALDSPAPPVPETGEDT